jgi:beta-1,3-galactosyltransferase 1
VSVDDYSEDEFPPYCLGGGYLLSQDVLSRIIKPMYTERVIHLEDIFIGVLVNKLNIQPIDNRKRFNLLFTGNKRLCDYLHTLLQHPVRTSELLSMHLQANLAWRVC